MKERGVAMGDLAGEALMEQKPKVGAALVAAEVRLKLTAEEVDLLEHARRNAGDERSQP